MNEPIVTLATPEKLTVQTSVDQCSGDDKTVLTKSPHSRIDPSTQAHPQPPEHGHGVLI